MAERPDLAVMAGNCWQVYMLKACAVLRSAYDQLMSFGVCRVLSSSPRPGQKTKLGLNGAKIERQIEDEARFLRSWFERPLVTGAVSPSGRVLARTMASYVDPSRTGPIIELGPGTGPVTEALLKRGVPAKNLFLVEFNPDFVRLLRKRFPEVTVIEGDAYNIAKTLKGHVDAPASAIVSSLPLLTKAEPQRIDLLRLAFTLMEPAAPFIQFTYMRSSPVPTRAGGFTAEASGMVWMNLPPARVWVYRQTT